MYEQLMADFTYKLCEFSTAALKKGIRSQETETESRKWEQKQKWKRNTESVKEGSKRSI